MRGTCAERSGTGYSPGTTHTYTLHIMLLMQYCIHVYCRVLICSATAECASFSLCKQYRLFYFTVLLQSAYTTQELCCTARIVVHCVCLVADCTTASMSVEEAVHVLSSTAHCLHSCSLLSILCYSNTVYAHVCIPIVSETERIFCIYTCIYTHYIH
jgi:hypothetical protein